MGKSTPPKYLTSARNDIGKKFGKLTVLEITDFRSRDRKIIVRCICDCGNETTVRLSTLRTGNQISCGCSHIETAKENGRKAIAIMIGRGLWEKEPHIATAKQIYKYYSDGDLSFQDFLHLSQQNCFYCGRAPSNKTNYYTSNRYSEERRVKGFFIYNGLDRVDNNLSHIKSNVVPCCLSCNKAKLTRTQEEFFSWIKDIYNLHCKN